MGAGAAGGPHVLEPDAVADGVDEGGDGGAAGVEGDIDTGEGKILGTIPRFFHLSMGDVFRALDTRTSIGQKFMDYSSRGQLVPFSAFSTVEWSKGATQITGFNYYPAVRITGEAKSGVPQSEGGPA